MDTATMKSRLSALTEETDNNILSAYLELAASVVLDRCYPFRTQDLPVPERYHVKQLNIAVYLLNKRGAEGETRHNENGIDRTYASADVPEDMLKGITPIASLLSKG